ncbi:hypothetical protein BDF20DRAFT_827491 [Mycotypha africana]|uniref:uncharacterized protein n=1 Tax=Mycotypha africana TaxID=64632 RepID=UPI002301569B|nr:uncharacterized protein BDF20DRAFT_827491 [Mycotypha africana]KAI8968933.1 hypothetical protein BDF20DRAFT_827491 [Mycotypha africana]
MPIFVPFLTGAKELSIDLAEPVVILRGTAADDTKHVLQGEVSLVLTRPISVSEVNIKFVGKSYSLWPEGLGHKSNKLYHKKTIHTQSIILENFNEHTKKEGVLSAGIHRWPFQFILSNALAETIEDEMAKVFYYLTTTVHRTGKGTTKLQARQDVLILRLPNWSDTALTANSLPSSSIISDRRLEVCDAIICIEKSYVSSGTQFPIAFTISPNMKNTFIESISVLLTEKRKYKLPEFNARRIEQHDFKLSLTSFTSLLADSELTTTQAFYAQPTLRDMRRLLNVKNAHMPLDQGAFRHRLLFTLPNCVQLNHTSTYSEISIKHTLRIQIELSSPTASHRNLDPHKPPQDTVYTKVHLETPITILDCRLKEDYNTLPTYEETLLVSSLIDDDIAESKPSGFFMCPCYLEYRKKTKCSRRDWIKIRDQFSVFNDSTPPPSYESLQ